MDQAQGTDLRNYITNICHELQSPLQGIFGNLEQLRNALNSLRSKIDSETLSELDDYLNGIDVSVKHQMSVTSKFLTTAKLEEAKLDLHPSIVDTTKTIQDVIRIFKPNLNPKQRIVIEFPEERVFVKADETQLKQIAINLIGNALKFTPEGLITVGLKYTFDTNTDEYDLSFYVSDTGIGMTEEEQKRLFQRFAQANNSIATQFGGFGLGLIICKGLVELMGGKISVESTKGQGTKFTVALKLPRATNPDQEKIATAAVKELSNVNGTILPVVKSGTILPQNFFELIESGGTD